MQFFDATGGVFISNERDKIGILFRRLYAMEMIGNGGIYHDKCIPVIKTVNNFDKLKN